MMKQIVETNWKGQMAFSANVGGHKIEMDASADNGGGDNGARPKQLMMAALAGCTGMDVVSILKKMKVELDSFDIRIEAEMTEEHPKQYSQMHIIYLFKGKTLDIEKLNRAVELSQEKYCGVTAMYRKAMNISYEIKIVE
ncbi:MAG: OsmC family protein [Bacteroidota bacterium]